jgi:hypothetical protein
MGRKFEGVCVCDINNEKGKGYMFRGTRRTNVRNLQFNIRLYHTVIYYDYSNNQ